MRRSSLVLLPLILLLAGCSGSVGGGYDRVVEIRALFLAHRYFRVTLSLIHLAIWALASM